MTLGKIDSFVKAVFCTILNNYVSAVGRVLRKISIISFLYLFSSWLIIFWCCAHNCVKICVAWDRINYRYFWV